MAYNFDQLIDRRRTQNIKWHRYDEDVLPMWVADMDFLSPEPVRRALQDRVAHGIYGYEHCPAELREVIVARLKCLYDWVVSPEALVFLPGVVAGFHLATTAFVNRGAGVLVQTPVYPPIYKVAEATGVTLDAMELTRRDDYAYEVDFDLFRQTLVAHTEMFLLCNPHNPVGRVFTEGELAKMAELCLQNDVIICSDEIHGDLIFSESRHCPIAALDEKVAARTITLMAPSKTFNIPGLHCSFAVIPDPELRAQVEAARRGMVGTVNVLGYTAALAAYRAGQSWLDALLIYLEQNRDLVYDFVTTQLPDIRMAKPEGTFLAWVDCRLAEIPGHPHDFFLEKARVALNDGSTFGPGGEGFVRLNFACPRSVLLTGLERMRQSLISHS